MNKREFLMLAHEYESKHDISGWWVSEKLDGQRAFWDGGISRGLDARDVPYANTAKDARFIERPVATGLWSRYGKVIHAPDWWLDGLPVGPTLDMELWCGRGSFQSLRSTVGSLDKGEGWRKVRGIALDSPGWHAVLADGELTGPNWKGFLDRSMLAWVEARMHKLTGSRIVVSGLGQPDECFGEKTGLRKLYKEQLVAGSPAIPTWTPHVQTKLPRDLNDARSAVDDMLLLVTQGGGEGLVLRSPTSPWVPKRVNWVLKVKKLSDAEGTVVGYTWGRETALGSRLLGKMGALVLDFRGKRLELSGFTDAERGMVLGTPCARDAEAEPWARPGMDVLKDGWANPNFPVGSKVTFTYRELTNDGIPKEARYLRKRGDE